MCQFDVSIGSPDLGPSHSVHTMTDMVSVRDCVLRSAVQRAHLSWACLIASLAALSYVSCSTIVSGIQSEVWNQVSPVQMNPASRLSSVFY